MTSASASLSSSSLLLLSSPDLWRLVSSEERTVMLLSASAPVGTRATLRFLCRCLSLLAVELSASEEVSSPEDWSKRVLLWGD